MTRAKSKIPSLRGCTEKIGLRIRKVSSECWQIINGKGKPTAVFSTEQEAEFYLREEVKHGSQDMQKVPAKFPF